MALTSGVVVRICPRFDTRHSKDAMYALRMNLAHEASACLIGEHAAGVHVREGAPAGQADACVPDAAGRWLMRPSVLRSREVCAC